MSHRQISTGLTMHVNCPHRRQAGFRTSGQETCENTCQGVSRSGRSQTDGAISGKPSLAVFGNDVGFGAFHRDDGGQRGSRPSSSLQGVLDHIFTTNVEKCRHLS